MTLPATRTIRLQAFVHDSPTKVFKAISEPEILTRWFMDRATFEPVKGGRYSFSSEGGPTHTGKVLEFVRGKHLTLTWQWPGQERLGVTKFRLSVESRGGGTVVKFVHSGFKRRGAWVELYEGAIHGWSYFLMNLKSVVEHGHDLRSPLDW
jgi:uncharacterized protein YndB with AHSA1/START domain